MIYFITSNDIPDYPIKIGCTHRGVKDGRIPQLQVGNPHKLIVMAVSNYGGFKDETRWHKEFAEDHIAGEWFKRTDRLMDAISKMETEEVRDSVGRPPKKYNMHEFMLTYDYNINNNVIAVPKTQDLTSG